MSPLQFLLILAVLVIALLALRALRGEKSLALKRLFALLGAVCAILFILVPEILTAIAHRLGIGRGTDLLLYLTVIAGMACLVAIIRAKARSDARVTELARAVALLEAREAEHSAAAEHGDVTAHSEAKGGDELA